MDLPGCGFYPQNGPAGITSLEKRKTDESGSNAWGRGMCGAIEPGQKRQADRAPRLVADQGPQDDEDTAVDVRPAGRPLGRVVEDAGPRTCVSALFPATA